MAYVEAKMVVAMVLQQFEVKVSPGESARVCVTGGVTDGWMDGHRAEGGVCAVAHTANEAWAQGPCCSPLMSHTCLLVCWLSLPLSICPWFSLVGYRGNAGCGRGTAACVGAHATSAESVAQCTLAQGDQDSILWFDTYRFGQH